MNLEERLQKIEHEIDKLKVSGVQPEPSVELLLAVKRTIDVLDEWREGKKNLLDDPDYEDYRQVISTLPILEKAYYDCTGRKT